jgi:hypothetical protein
MTTTMKKMKTRSRNIHLAAEVTRISQTEQDDKDDDDEHDHEQPPRSSFHMHTPCPRASKDGDLEQERLTGKQWQEGDGGASNPSTNQHPQHSHLLEVVLAKKQREDRYYGIDSFVLHGSDEHDNIIDDGMIHPAWRHALVCDWIPSCVSCFDLGDGSADEDEEEEGGDAAAEAADAAASSQRMVSLAISYLDRFLATLPLQARQDQVTCQLSALVAVHLARALVCGSRYAVLPFQMLLALVDDSSRVSPQKLAHIEMQMLTNLRFTVHPPLACEYLHCFKSMMLQEKKQGSTSTLSMLAPLDCDYLEEQANTLATMAVESGGALVSVPQHVIAYVALAVMMEYTYWYPSSSDEGTAEFKSCKSFLNDLGQTLDLNVESSLALYQDAAFSGHDINASETSSQGDSECDHIRMVRALLWKIVLEQPAVAEKLHGMAIPLWAPAEIITTFKTVAGECFPSPHSVAALVVHAVPLTQEVPELTCAHILWWESYIVQCKARLHHNGAGHDPQDHCASTASNKANPTLVIPHKQEGELQTQLLPAHLCLPNLDDLAADNEHEHDRETNKVVVPEQDEGALVSMKRPRAAAPPHTRHSRRRRHSHIKEM